MQQIHRLYIVILAYCCIQQICTENTKELANGSTAVAPETDDRLLLFATLDGSLIAIEQQTGKIRWKIKDRPIVRVPLDTADAIVPIFLPDPRDGSLYLYGHSKEPLKKLPFTIPQLVAASPCRSSDGILYTGKKKDTWYRLDPKTGYKKTIVGWDVPNPTCPLETNNYVFIGRTKYDIKMVDSRNPLRKWNVTYVDYTAASMTQEEQNNYEWVHFTSTSSGRLITMDRRRGNLLWDGDLGSPIVGIYILDAQGLITAPFTSLANHTIDYMAREFFNSGSLLESPLKMKLYPTLYVGEHLYGLYALPSLVDQNVVTITASQDGPLLLSGPHAPSSPKPYPEYPLPGRNYRLPQNLYNDDSMNFQSMPSFNNHLIIFTGHYNVPNYSENRFMFTQRIEKTVDLITDQSTNLDNGKLSVNSIGIQTDNDVSNIVDDEIIDTENSFEYYYQCIKLWINQQENKGLKLMLIVLSGCVCAMFWYLQMQVREFQNLSQNGSKSSQGTNSRNGTVTAFAEELPDGLVRVGKITFHPEQLLGKGCEGTFVYRGEFDGRRVAVKRLLPECFTFADREVALLRESDAHPNVIRYYCMEQDRMFRYIALELCQATLSEYIQGKCNTNAIKPLDILRQATAGLAHLHSLDIVHRDIKPHNVLLSCPNNRGEVRAMISDFGLCKKLQVGRISFSRRSGVTGTDGWIAPEMLNGNQRTTYAVDLFSLGCLYYYVLSKGLHPFGDTLRRQANILNHEYNLNDLLGSDWEINLQKPLISALISSLPDDRPPCEAVLKHPIFWTNAEILAFFQDVSDRVEKADQDDVVLQQLEYNGRPIVRYDWRSHIHEEVASDLRKYRTYRGDSVRDLLRALRNKKHHFRELSKEAQEHLGEVPDAFTCYWTERFPLLFVHTWITMQCVANEITFRPYYHHTHRYSLDSFHKQVLEYIEENPIDVPNITTRQSSLNNLDASSSKNKSPKRNFNSFTTSRNTYGRRERENVGLYRNFNTKTDNKVPILDVNDVHVTFAADDMQVQRRNRYKKVNNKKKGSEEPTVWAVNK